MHFECDISSIHFPHPREDCHFFSSFIFLHHFNPLPSSEGRQHSLKILVPERSTSIHFPHPREDSLPKTALNIWFTSIHFPHPREDHVGFCQASMPVHFNPLPSSEGRRYIFSRLLFQFFTSIHFPHPREDSTASPSSRYAGYFNPLPSSEGRRRQLSTMKRSLHFNPLPSSEGRHSPQKMVCFSKDFNPLPSSEGRRAEYWSYVKI